MNRYKIDPPLEGVLFHIIEKTIKSYQIFWNIDNTKNCKAPM